MQQRPSLLKALKVDLPSHPTWLLSTYLESSNLKITTRFRGGGPFYEKTDWPTSFGGHCRMHTVDSYCHICARRLYASRRWILLDIEPDIHLLFPVRSGSRRRMNF